MTAIFVIINESLPEDSEYELTDVIPVARWSYQDALDDLAEIADESGIEVGDDDTVISLPVKGTGLKYDNYYVIALEVLDRG